MMSIYPYPGERNITKEEIILASKVASVLRRTKCLSSLFRLLFQCRVTSPNYSLEDVYAIDSGVVFTLGKVLDELSTLDLSNIKKFPIPVFMFCGRYDYTTPTLPTVQWIKNVKAPIKK